MILVDASVLIDALRKKDAKLQKLFATVRVAVCGISQAEVLVGAKDAKHYAKLEAALAKFPQIPIPESIWKALARNLFLLRSQGVTVPFPDAALATLALENQMEVWTRDAHFPLMQTIFPTLKLFQEPA